MGFGRIGREMAKKARAFNMKILYYDKIQFPREVEEEYGAEYAPLHKLLRVGVRASRRLHIKRCKPP